MSGTESETEELPLEHHEEPAHHQEQVQPQQRKCFRSRKHKIEKKKINS